MGEREVIGRPIDVSGVYRRPSGSVEVKGPEDLVKNGIAVSPDAVEATWGMEAREQYVEGMKNMTNGMRQNGQPAPKAEAQP